MKQGRPKDPRKARNRIVSVVLSEKALIVYRDVCSSRKDKRWFHRYVSERVIDDFIKDPEKMVRKELVRLQQQRNEIDDLIKAKAEDLKKIRKSSQRP